MKKKALTGIEQIMVIILIVLTLAAVFMALAKGDILTKIKNLPSFNHDSPKNSGDEVIIPTQDGKVDSKACPVTVGKLETDPLSGQVVIKVCQDTTQKGCLGFALTGFKIDGGQVQIERTEWWKLWGALDQKAGVFEDGTIYLNDFGNSLKDYKYVAKTQRWLVNPLLSYMNLNGAEKGGQNGMELCRDKMITWEELCPIKIGEVRDKKIFICERGFFTGNYNCEKMNDSKIYLDTYSLVLNGLKYKQTGLFNLDFFKKDKDVGSVNLGMISGFGSEAGFFPVGSKILPNGDICTVKS